MPCKSAGSAAAAVAGAAMAGAAAYLWWTIRPAPPPGRRKLQGYALTLAELAGYDGQDGSKPTLVAIRNQVGVGVDGLVFAEDGPGGWGRS